MIDGGRKMFCDSECAARYQQNATSRAFNGGRGQIACVVCGKPVVECCILWTQSPAYRCPRWKFYDYPACDVDCMSEVGRRLAQWPDDE
jgi:hypothetical protein